MSSGFNDGPMRSLTCGMSVMIAGQEKEGRFYSLCVCDAMAENSIIFKLKCKLCFRIFLFYYYFLVSPFPLLLSSSMLAALGRSFIKCAARPSY